MDDIRDRFPAGADAPSPSPDRQMRPLVLINHLVEPPGRITGITRYAFGLMEAMIRRGDTRLLLVTSWTREQLPPGIAAGLEHLFTLPHIESTPVNNLRQRRVLGEIARGHSVDVVYAMNPMCPPVRGIASVNTLHDLYYEILPHLYTRRHRLWWKLFFGDAARRASRIACASANSAADATRLHPSLSGKTSVVAGAGVLPKGNAPLPKELEGEPYVLLLGNVTPNKNIGFAVGALRLLARQGRPVRALHVGRDLTGDLAKALSDDGAILLQTLGGLDDSALDAVLRNACALVQPSRYEGFGLPIIEAQERGVPVVASDIAVFREVTGDGGVLVKLDDIEGFADALYRLTNDRLLRAELSTKALANSARFTWDKSAEAAVAMIRELCAA